MKRDLELLAPGGEVDSIKSAILAGADAVYCGLNRFNARNRAANIGFDELQGLLRLAHNRNCKIFLTLNIIIFDNEIPALIKLLNRLQNTSIDGVIIQDFGLFYLLNNYFKKLRIHASTQMTTHNKSQILFLKKLNAERVNLSRELNISEISEISSLAHTQNIQTEVFVHGSYCISFSGICYMSSLLGGNSGNRGRCSQPCRKKYIKTPAGNQFPLNMKDNSAYLDLAELHEAGVDSLKIEGRIKGFEYVYTVVEAWRKQIDRFRNNEKMITDNTPLYKVFNRDFTNGYLKGKINKSMFIDNPMSYSSKYHSEINNYSPKEKNCSENLELYAEKEQLQISIKKQIDKFNIQKIPIKIKVLGSAGKALVFNVKTPDDFFELHSNINFSDSGIEELTPQIIQNRLYAINETHYELKNLDFDIDSKLYLPFYELNSLKKKLLCRLNDSNEYLQAIQISKLKPINESKKVKLSVLISSVKDIFIYNNTFVEVYFELPNRFKNQQSILLSLFIENRNLIPWFPSVLIGDDYDSAVDFLLQLKPKKIVSNNSGIAYEAYLNGIEWIAGPFMNIANSYSLLALKENFDCSGAFVSNELSKMQVVAIKKTRDFNLHYVIYQPIELMTSRQCLFHQVTACKKQLLDKTCISDCEKSAIITNLKKEKFVINKTKGNYHKLYNAINLLNTDIVKDLSHRFSSFMIDFREIKTETHIKAEKTELIELFENLLNGKANSVEELTERIQPVTNIQYQKGV